MEMTGECSRLREQPVQRSEVGPHLVPSDHKEELVTGRVGRARVSGAVGSRLWTQADEPCQLISVFTDPSAYLV